MYEITIQPGENTATGGKYYNIFPERSNKDLWKSFQMLLKTSGDDVIHFTSEQEALSFLDSIIKEYDLAKFDNIEVINKNNQVIAKYEKVNLPPVIPVDTTTLGIAKRKYPDAICMVYLLQSDNIFAGSKGQFVNSIQDDNLQIYTNIDVAKQAKKHRKHTWFIVKYKYNKGKIIKV